jgi:hypothetical protein
MICKPSSVHNFSREEIGRESWVWWNLRDMPGERVEEREVKDGV